MCGTAMKLRDGRSELLNVLRKNGVSCKGPAHMPFNQYVKAMQTSKFVWSPPGHGWSNHRDFEALLAGSVPVVAYHPSFVELYRDLPVVQVMNWTMVTTNFLTQQWQHVQSRRNAYNLNKVYWPYWLKRLTAYMKPVGSKTNSSGDMKRDAAAAQPPSLRLNITTSPEPPTAMTSHPNTTKKASKSSSSSLLQLFISSGGGTTGGSLIFPGHEAEILRQRAIAWSAYKPFMHHMPRTSTRGQIFPDQLERMSADPCFPGCTPIDRKNKQFSVSSEKHSELHGPGSFSLVLPWCCEWVSWILNTIDFRGKLKEIFLYDKCSKTVSHLHSKAV